MLIVGSHALQKYLASISPNDLDVFCSYDDCRKLGKAYRVQYPIDSGKKIILKQDGRIVECEIAWENSTADKLLQLTEHISPVVVNFNGVNILGRYADKDILYTLKSSHKFLRNSPHFEKTRRDILYLESIGAKIPDYLKDWFTERESETYWYKHPNLNQTKDNFFKDDGIKYVYDHDTIHESVALGAQPAYTYFKKDGAQVAVDRNKWNSLDESVRLASVIEEASVLAIERSIVPHPGVLTPAQAFKKALQKVCTSITSGWWRDYAWLNYDKALSNYNLNYVDKFWKDVESGKVKKL